MLALIDNYDSFTYNLVHYAAEEGADVQVFRNDSITAEELVEKHFPEKIIISPGPGTPDEAGISLEIIKLAANKKIPLFGVCLGHQAIGQYFGGNVIKTSPMHGKTSAIRHLGKNIFADIPSPFVATRYHSLIIESSSFPKDLQITATTDDDEEIIMAIEHKNLPIYGVQFHPESIASQYGHKIIRNFLRL